MPSIRDLAPQHTGGAPASHGFEYQAMYAAGVCFEAVQDPSIAEIWVEVQDDITVLRSAPPQAYRTAAGAAGALFVQHMQCKTNTVTWTPAALLGKDSRIPQKQVELAVGHDEVAYFVLAMTERPEPTLDKLQVPHSERSTVERQALLDSFNNQSGASWRSGLADRWLVHGTWDYTGTYDHLRRRNVEQLHKIVDARGRFADPVHLGVICDFIKDKCRSRASDKRGSDNYNRGKLLRAEVLGWVEDAVAGLPSKPYAAPKAASLVLDIDASGQLQCSGDIAPEELDKAWGDPFSTTLDPIPATLIIKAPTAPWIRLRRTVVRLGLHGGLAHLRVPVSSEWHAEPRLLVLGCLGTGAPCTMEFAAPILPADTQETTCTTRWSVDTWAEELEMRLDAWVWVATQRRIYAILGTPGGAETALGFVIHKDVRSAMARIWDEWLLRLQGDKALRQATLLDVVRWGRDANADEMRERLGPRTVDSCVVPALVLALATAVAYKFGEGSLGPRSTPDPGRNFVVTGQVADGDPAHVIGLTRTDRKDVDVSFDAALGKSEPHLVITSGTPTRGRDIHEHHDMKSASFLESSPTHRRYLLPWPRRHALVTWTLGIRGGMMAGPKELCRAVTAELEAIEALDETLIAPRTAQAC